MPPARLYSDKHLMQVEALESTSVCVCVHASICVSFSVCECESQGQAIKLQSDEGWREVEEEERMEGGRAAAIKQS